MGGGEGQGEGGLGSLAGLLSGADGNAEEGGDQGL